jgi:transglutaminase-like putative cysteine protease
MPAILIPITLVPIAWRLLAEFRNWKPMPLIFRVFATVVAVSVLVVTYGGLMGRRAAVSLLVMMLALKLLETFSIRDARIVASLCLFLCATQFLFSQRFAMVFYIVACLLSTLIALMYLHRQEAYLPIHEAPDTGRSMFTELGFGLRLLLLAFPIGLTMFLLFPRWSSPLWGVPEAALDARSGLSNSMTPGSIQNLFMDDSPAFRATFQGSVPNNVFMYWRGPVFWDFDGQTWQSSYLSRNLPAETKPSLADAQFRYEIQMEPTEQHWIFALDYPAMVPKGTRLTMDYQLVSRRSITQLRIYPMASDPAFQDSPELKNTLLRAALETPVGYNPRTAQMMSEWRAETSSDAEIIRRALAYFNQEEFHYTLNPPLLSRHTVDEFLFETRRGFCEHYASAFTIMMRMAGIPARVVTGYQGGWYSGIGSYVLVRQSDAHAWSEVWIKGTGWTRIDPTAAVAPDRVEQGAMNSLAERRHLLDFEWLMSARNTLDLLQRGWNNWVIAFGADAQSRLFTIFGWGIFDSARLIIAMMSIIMVAGTAIFLLLPFFFRFRAAREQDAVLKLWQKFIRKLEKAGFTAKPSMGPIELGTLAGAQLEFAANRIEQITELYIRCRYSKNTDGREKLTELVRDFKPQTAA